VHAFLLTVFIAHVTPAEHIARGQQLLNELEYEEAGDELTQAAIDPTASEEERIRANLLAGIAHRVTGRDVEARANFRYVLQRNPNWQLADDTPPKVRLFFETVRQELAGERASNNPIPTTSIAPAASAEPGTPIILIAGGTVTATGAVVAVAGTVGLAFAENSLDDPSRLGGERTDLRNFGKLSTAAAAIGIVVAGAGAAMMLWAGP
jgi:hypothetical protein